MFASGDNEINHNFAAISKLGYLVWIGLYLLIGFCLLLGFEDLRRSLKLDVIALALFSFVVFSTAWSQMQGYALYTSLQLVPLSFFAMMAGHQLSLGQAWSATALASLIMIIASLLFIFLIPQLGIEQATQNKGAWCGGYLEKNIFGAFLVLASATAFIEIIGTHGWRRITATVVWTICILTLIPSKATTALLIALSVPLLTFLLLTLQASRQQALTAAGLVIPFSGVVIVGGLLFSGDILDLIGKDASLTGRDEL